MSVAFLRPFETIAFTAKESQQFSLSVKSYLYIENQLELKVNPDGMKSSSLLRKLGKACKRGAPPVFNNGFPKWNGRQTNLDRRWS
ncbi:Uncharacterised protein r2_g2755 [Pycnogonum litorale]